MPNHAVVPGDCFNSIAKSEGFYNYLTVYNQGTNRTNFPNPNMLEEGTTVDVPDKKPKKAPLNLDAKTGFVVDRQKTKFRVVLLDTDFQTLQKINDLVGKAGHALEP